MTQSSITHNLSSAVPRCRFRSSGVSNESRCCGQADSINAGGGRATGVQCDVTDEEAQSAAFREHVQRHGGMDVAVLNAGILESGESPASMTSVPC